MLDKFYIVRNLYKNIICYNSEGYDWNKDDFIYDMSLFCNN